MNDVSTSDKCQVLKRAPFTFLMLLQIPLLKQLAQMQLERIAIGY